MKEAISYISVVVDVHVGRGSELRPVLQSGVLVRQLDPFLSQGLTHRLVPHQRDSEKEGSKDTTIFTLTKGILKSKARCCSQMKQVCLMQN